MNNRIKNMIEERGMFHENELYEISEAVVKDIATWIGTQRNDVPANGHEFEVAIKERYGIK